MIAIRLNPCVIFCKAGLRFETDATGRVQDSGVLIQKNSVHQDAGLTLSVDSLSSMRDVR